MARNYVIDEELTKKEGRTVVILEKEGYSPRRYTRGKSKKGRNGTRNGRMIAYARYLWMKHYPNDEIKNDENIHHKDFNSMNDDISNLQKMKICEHFQLHKAINQGRRCKIID